MVLKLTEKNKKLFFCVGALVSLFLFINAGFTQEKKNFYQIHEINENKLASGIYSITGFVAKIYTCPPCPRGVQCKVCMNDNIVISEEKKITDMYYLTNKELIVFVKDPKQFKLGKKYRFLVKISDRHSTSQPINDIDLLEYNRLE